MSNINLDNYEKLLSLGKYEEILESLKDEEIDLNVASFKVAALFNLNRDDEAKEFLRLNRKKLEEENLYKGIKLIFEFTLLSGDYRGARKLYEEYRDYPYHSQIVEEYVQAMPERIEQEIESDKRREEIKKNGDPNVINKLKEFTYSEDVLSYALNANKKEAKFYRPYLLMYLEDRKVTPIVKNKILYSLFRLYPGDKFIYTNDIETFVLNSVLNPFFIDSIEAQKIINALHKYHENVTYVEIAKNFMDIYFMAIYPYEVREFDANLYAAAFLQTSSLSLMKEDISLSLSKFYKVNQKDINDLSKEIMRVVDEAIIEEGRGYGK